MHNDIPKENTLSIFLRSKKYVKTILKGPEQEIRDFIRGCTLLGTLVAAVLERKWRAIFIE